MGVRISDLAITAEYTELIALGVGEGHPSIAVGSAVIGDLSGTETEQPRYLRFAGRIGGPKIKMEPVLHPLRFWHLDEQ